MKIIENKYHIGYTAAGTSMEVSCFIIDSGKPGKNIGVQSGLHGGETTYWIVKNIYNRAKKNLQEGRLIIIPLANPVGWNQRLYFSTVGKFELHEGKDPNRLFPGDFYGSISQRICARLVDIIKDCDVVIDLHTSRKSIPYTIITNDKHIDLASKLGLEYNYYSKVDIGCFSDYLSSIGINSITIECGGHDEYNQVNIDIVTRGIIRLLDSNYTILIQNGKYYSGSKKVYSNHHGFVVFAKSVGSAIKTGDIIAKIHDPNNLEIENNIVAIGNGIMYKQFPSHIIWTGDQVYEYFQEETQLTY